MVSTVINVDVNPSAFDAFRAKFQAYAEKLDATPGVMAKVSRSSEETAVHFEALAAAITDQADAISKIASGSVTLRQNSEATARHWHGLHISTQGVAKNIGTATESLLKWGAVIGSMMISGAVGALAGTVHYAPIVGGNRTAAMGLGASYGSRQSFLTHFGRITDPEGFLSRVNEVEHRADNVPLTALGLTQQQAQGDTADVAANAILQLKRIVDGVKDPRFLNDTLRANRADELISLNQAQILRGMTPEEVQGLVSSYRRDKSRLALSEDSQRKYQDFATRLDRSSKKIENTFIKRLGALTPGMTKLTVSFEHVVDVLMKKDGPLSQWLGLLNEGVEWLAKNIDTPEFQSKVEGFVSGIGKVADAVGDLLTGVVSLAKWFGITPAEASTGGSGSGAFGVGTGLRARNSAGGARDMGGGDALTPGSGGGVAGLRGPAGSDDLPPVKDVPQAVFDLAARGEAAGYPGGGYNTILGGGQLDLEHMTLDQVMALHKDSGRWQLTAPTIAEFKKKLHLSGNEKFDRAMQKKIIGALIAETHGDPRKLRGRFMSLHNDDEINRAWHTPNKPAAAPANTTTRVTITKPTGSDPSTAAASAAGQ